MAIFNSYVKLPEGNTLLRFPINWGTPKSPISIRYSQNHLLNPKNHGGLEHQVMLQAEEHLPPEVGISALSCGAALPRDAEAVFFWRREVGTMGKTHGFLGKKWGTCNLGDMLGNIYWIFVENRWNMMVNVAENDETHWEKQGFVAEHVAKLCVASSSTQTSHNIYI